VTPRAVTSAGAALAVAAAATGVHGLFAGWSWYLPTLGGVLLAVLAGAAGRRLRLPGPLVVVVRLLVLLEYALLLDARRHAFLRVVPTVRAMSSLGHTVSLAVQDMRVLVVPVAVRPPLTLVVVAAVYVIAVVVDELAAARRPGLAGVALVLLLAVPAGIHGTRVGVAAFTVGAAGWLVLLGLDQRGWRGFASVRRFRREGGSLDRARGERARGERTPTTGWRVGATALAVAALVPLALPTLHHNFFADGAGPGNGNIVITVIPPMVTVDRELHQKQTVDLLTVRTADPQYLRLTTLESFDGVSFTLGSISAPASQEVGHGLPPAPGRVDTDLVHLSVTGAKPLAENYLPLPYSPVAVRVAGDWRLDLGTRTVFSTTSTTSGLTYSATSAVAQPDAAQAAATGPASPEPGLSAQLVRDEYVPSYELAALRLLALDATRGARTAFQEAVDIQNYLRSAPFTYKLNVAPMSGPEALETFLESTHTGYCQQFAVAMAALARALGLPSRVAVGFTDGTRIAPDTYQITNHDAHAWPEIWFPNTGWLRFEAAPSRQTPSPSYTNPPARKGAKATAPHPKTGKTPRSPSAGRPRQRIAIPQGAGHPPAGHRAVHRNRGTGALWPVVAVLLLAVLAVALAPAGARAGGRRRRLGRISGGGAPAALAAWAEVLDTAEDLGIAVPAGCSPRAVGRLLAATAPERASVLEPATARLVAGIELARYARPSQAEGTGVMRSDVTLLVRALMAAADPGRRWRSRLLPASVLRRAATPVASGIADLLDRVDTVIGWVTRRVIGPGTAR